MSEDVAIVTGATGGIGLPIARGLAAAGRTVVLIARNPAKAAVARSAVEQAASGGAHVFVELADLSSRRSVDDLAARLLVSYPRISLLINNAGVMTTRKTLSPDGIELDLAINHLAPFLLTWRLLPALRQQNGGPAARVVTTNSAIHEKARLTEASFTPAALFRMSATYGVSKLANMAATVEFAARVPATEVTFNAVHPGVVATNLMNDTPLIRAVYAGMKLFMLSPAQGAETPLWAATASELATASGNYYKKRALSPMNPLAQDGAFRSMVWTQTRALLGLSDDIG